MGEGLSDRKGRQARKTNLDLFLRTFVTDTSDGRVPVIVHSVFCAG